MYRYRYTHIEHTFLLNPYIPQNARPALGDGHGFARSLRGEFPRRDAAPHRGYAPRHTYIYIYIYRERERDVVCIYIYICIHIYIYIYIYIYTVQPASVVESTARCGARFGVDVEVS